jgi:hypothetical protein
MRTLTVSMAAIGLCLGFLAAAAVGDAPMIHCIGQAGGGHGTTDYAYLVDSVSFPMMEFSVGTNDLDLAHYSNVLVPEGWRFDLIDEPAAHLCGEFTPHGEISPGPCWCLTEGQARWWAQDYAHAVEHFTFGFDHPGAPHDVAFRLTTQRGSPAETYTFGEFWDAPVGTGYGPVHGPSDTGGVPTLEWDLVWGNCLTGTYAYEFTVHGNDAQSAAFFVDIHWEGIDTCRVDADESVLYEPWASNAVIIEREENLLRIAAGTGPSSEYETLPLAEVVVTESHWLMGVLGFHGTISRGGIDYQVEGVAPLPLAGDANLDGGVSDADYTIWADHYGQAGGWREGDFSGDRRVTGADYTIWADNYGGAGSGVPEPGMLLLLGLGATVVLRRRANP